MKQKHETFEAKTRCSINGLPKSPECVFNPPLAVDKVKTKFNYLNSNFLIGGML
ncbi:MAG: hypothetical protein PWP64_1521 [Candidatus Cloacimonadota bacterium]|nr:hypothetical protein [Candidatus Cloacimonadota bacterium]